MNANRLTMTMLLLLAAMLVGCGGGQDADESGASSDGMADSQLPSAAVRTENAAEEAADAVEDAAETAGEEMDNAADQVADMADDAADQVEQMAGEVSDRAEDMANQAEDMAGEMADQAEQMASEAGDEAEAAVAGAAGAMGMDDNDSASDDPCVVNVGVGDSIAYSVDSISVPSSCESVTVNLTHSGSLPKEAMGHNWVLVPADAINAIGNAGMSAGADANYVPDDDRIVAATDVVGGGESTSVTFSLADLEDGVDYAYVCTFPGHWSVMQGPFTVE